MTQQLDTDLVPQWTLGDRLRKAREIAGLEAVQLADEIGVNRGTIANYEKGRVRPRQIVLRAWAARTGVPLAWLEHGVSAEPAAGAATVGGAAGTRSSTDRASDYGSELGRLTPVLALAAA